MNKCTRVLTVNSNRPGGTCGKNAPYGDERGTPVCGAHLPENMARIRAFFAGSIERARAVREARATAAQ